jgi:hypothetical protein
MSITQVLSADYGYVVLVVAVMAFQVIFFGSFFSGRARR